MIVLLIAQAAATLSAPQAPPLPIVMAPPPAFLPRVAAFAMNQGPRVRVGVTVRSPAGILWDGSLWVSGRGQSSWRQSVQEPQAEDCPRTRPYDSMQNEISVTLSPTGEAGLAPLVNVSVRWARPAEAACGGARIVELRETVSLEDGKPAVIRGDGGLVVELRRR